MDNKQQGSAIPKLKEKHPEIAQAFETVMKEEYELFARKMLDYGKSNITVGTNLETPEEVKLSMTGLFFRMNDKIQRIKNLLVMNNEPNVTDESILDTFKDLSIYGVIAQIVAAGRWK